MKPDPNKKYPVAGYNNEIYVKPFVQNPNIIVGDFTYIADSGFENHVTNFYPWSRDRLIIGKFCQIASGVEFMMNDANHQMNAVSTFPFYTLEGWDTEREPNNFEVGTHVWDSYPVYEDWIELFDIGKRRPDMGKLAHGHFGHLPVWIDGNAYFSGAKAFAKEKNNMIDSDTGVRIELTEKDGSYKLSTNLVELVKDFKVHMINTETLGMAFEPEEKYENTDGTPITFDEDYFGNKRGLNVIPGPFADEEVLKEDVY